MKKTVIPFAIASTLILVSFLLFGQLEAYFTLLLENSGDQRVIYSLLSFLILTSDIILPVPSTMVMYSNGFFLGTVQGMMLSFLSVMLGSALGYCLGRFSKIGTKAGRDGETASLLDRYGLVAILLSRGIPVLSESVSIVCGYNRVNLSSYLFINALGYIPVCSLFAYFGSMGRTNDILLLTFGCSVVLACLFLMAGHKFLKKINIHV